MLIANDFFFLLNPGDFLINLSAIMKKCETKKALLIFEPTIIVELKYCFFLFLSRYKTVLKILKNKSNGF